VGLFLVLLVLFIVLVGLFIVLVGLFIVLIGLFIVLLGLFIVLYTTIRWHLVVYLMSAIARDGGLGFRFRVSCRHSLLI